MSDPSDPIIVRELPEPRRPGQVVYLWRGYGTEVHLALRGDDDQLRWYPVSDTPVTSNASETTAAQPSGVPPNGADLG